MATSKYRKDTTDGEMKTISIAPTNNDKVKDLNLGNTIVKFAAQIITNLITTKQIIGIEDTNNKDAKMLLKRSKFYELFPASEKITALVGVSFVGLYYMGDTPYIKVFSNFGKYKAIGIDVIEFTAVVETMRDGNTGEHRVEVQYKKYNSLVPSDAIWLEQHGFTEDGVYQTIVEYDYTHLGASITNRTEGKPLFLKDHTYCPVTDIANTHEWISDAQIAGVEPLVSNLNYHSNQTIVEWELSKTVLDVRSGWGGDASALQVLQNLLSGGRTLTLSNQNSDTTNPIGSISYGGAGGILNQAIKADLEDKLLKYLFALRDSMATGANKQTTEIATFNQVATDMAIHKIERFRNNQWGHFWNDIVGEIIPAMANVEVSLVLNDTERNKLNSMDPMIKEGFVPPSLPKDMLVSSQAVINDATGGVGPNGKIPTPTTQVSKPAVPATK